MGDAGSTLHKCAGLAQIGISARRLDPQMCKARSTFPRMTTGTVSGTLKSVQPVSITPGWVRKGRNDGNTFSHSVTSKYARGRALCILRRIASSRAQLKPDLVAGVSAAGRHEHRAQPVSSLPPAPHIPPHRRRCQRPHVGPLWAYGTTHRPKSNPSTKDNGEGQLQASKLTCPSRWAWLDGR